MLMYSFIFTLMMLFMSSVLVYILKYKHFLLMLISLEAMVVSLYVLLFFYCSQFNYEYFISMFFLTFSICESSLGLSLLVLLIRTYGLDMVMVYNSLW
uniref:NADH dehydrogenase subunit 4L n=1 Tax=Hylurgus ligniperda TaxID=167147 RepID=UPI0027A4FE61|nr:NADH dehydrogenase subunit 4L [Hylurgus ligniperda]WGL40353.1 NADH dehydrogenase subunit 4L [Hylurgus ligniperda]WKD83327.1 NADH dehydrogenase subunit 4L [Hylurgus ligniperda]